MNYFDELTKAMKALGENPETLFVGQGVRYDGQRMFNSFSDVPITKRIEMPVAEDMQMGFCTGLSLMGFLPVAVYPRFDFLLLAVNQLVNHLDKLPLMSEYRPRMIIRTAVGSSSPFNPGPQHTQDHSEAFEKMLKTVKVVNLYEAEQIKPAYEQAVDSDTPTLLVEYMSAY